MIEMLNVITLQGINISHLGKRKIIFKMPFLGDMLVPWRVFLSDKRVLSGWHATRNVVKVVKSAHDLTFSCERNRGCGLEVQCMIFRCPSKHLHQEQQTWVIRSQESSTIHSPRLCGPVPTCKRIFELVSWHGQLGTRRSDYTILYLDWKWKKKAWHFACLTFFGSFFSTISSMNSCHLVSV